MRLIYYHTKMAEEGEGERNGERGKGRALNLDVIKDLRETFIFYAGFK